MRDETVRLFSFCLVLAAVSLIAAAEFFGDINSKYAIGFVVVLAGTGFARPGWVRRLVDRAALRWELHNESFYLASMTVLVGLSLWAIVWTILLANGLITEMPFGKVGWVASGATSATMSFLFFPWESLRRIYLYCERRAKRYGTLPRVWFKAISTGTVGGLLVVILVAAVFGTAVYNDVLILAFTVGTVVAFFAMPNPDWQSDTDSLMRKLAAKPWESDIKKQAWPAVSEHVNRQTLTEIQRLQATLTQLLTAQSAELTALRTQLATKSAQDQRHAAALQNVQDRLDRLETNLGSQIANKIEEFSHTPGPKLRLISNLKSVSVEIADQLKNKLRSDPNNGPQDGATP